MNAEAQSLPVRFARHFVSYVSPCRARNGGHYESYTTELVAAAQDLGADCVIGMGRKWPPFPRIADVSVNEIYDAGLEMMYGGPLRKLPYRIRVGLSISAFLKRHVEEGSVVFIDQPSFEDAVALRLSAGILAKRGAQVWVMLRCSDLDRFLDKWISCLLRDLRARERCDLRLLTDSEVVASDLAGLAPFYLVPIPHTPTHSPVEVADPHRPIIAWWAGAPRPTKGQAIIEGLAKRPIPPGLSIVLPEMPGLDSRDRLDVLPPYLSPAAYAAMLARTDVMLLPYDPLLYRSGTSGIFIETVVAGKVPLVMAGTWMAAILQRYDLKAFVLTPEEWRDEQLMERLPTLARNPDLARRLADLQRELVALHGPQPFRRALVECFQASDVAHTDMQTGASGSR